MGTPNPQQQLFPLGQVLWFVPKEVMVESDICRRENLLRTNKSSGVKETENAVDAHGRGLGDVITETLKNVAKKSGMKRRKRNKYDGSNYILTDASECRDIFQHFVQDMPESLYAHY